VRRLREENTLLRARLATAAKEKSEIISERDALLRKLNGVKQLLDGPAVRRAYQFCLPSTLCTIDTFFS
jgi:hypothetical protein